MGISSRQQVNDEGIKWLIIDFSLALAWTIIVVLGLFNQELIQLYENNPKAEEGQITLLNMKLNTLPIVLLFCLQLVELASCFKSFPEKTHKMIGIFCIVGVVFTAICAVFPKLDIPFIVSVIIVIPLLYCRTLTLRAIRIR